MTFEVSGNVEEEEKKKILEILSEAHEKLEKFDFKRIVLKCSGGENRNFFYKVRAFKDEGVVMGLNSNSFTSSPDKHILLLDIDLKEGVTPQKNIDNIKQLQSKFDLPTFYRYTSSKQGLFNLCFVELEFDELCEILAGVKCQDKNHLFYFLKNRFLTLRLDPKEDKPSQIHYLDKIPNESKARQELTGARMVFERLIENG